MLETYYAIPDDNGKYYLGPNGKYTLEELAINGIFNELLEFNIYQVSMPNYNLSL